MLLTKLLARIKALDLNLNGLTVLTEAASGPYIVTPIIAALAGAKVYAYTRNTKYGSANEIINNSLELVEEINATNAVSHKLEISFITNLEPDHISQANIITNSGHLRPLNREKLEFANDQCVIPLMYEAWELRKADIDLEYVKERGIKIAATNERHPDVDVFGYLGDMVIKQIFDAGLTPYKNKFILCVNNDFGPYIARTLSKVCQALAVIDKTENKEKYSDLVIEFICSFPSFDIPPHFRDAEAVIFTAYPFDSQWIGNNNQISAKQIASQLNAPYILRYAGDLDTKSLIENNIRFFPEHVASGHMGVLPSAVGMDPIIRLQTAGLKVGQALIYSRYMHNSLPILELI